MIGECIMCEAVGTIRKGLCNRHYQQARSHGTLPTGRAPVSDETRRKISETLKGNQNAAGNQNTLGKTWTLNEEQRQARKGPRPAMYSDAPGYMAIHNWMRRHHDKTGICEACQGDEGVTYWSNISGEYLRDRDDFWELCVPCHKLFDYILRIDQADPVLVAVLRAKRVS